MLVREQKCLQLKQAFLKPTHARLLILQVLNSQSRAALSAAEIYKKIMGNGSGVGLPTIYRVLGELEDVGLARKCSLRTGKSYFQLVCEDAELRNSS